MKKIFNFIIFILSFIFVTTPAIAGFGVSPADIYNDHLKPGAEFEKEIILSRSETDEDLKVSIETDLQETESWFQFTPGRDFIFPKGQSRYSLKIKVKVPNNADIKTYKGIIRIKASSADNKNSGVSIVKGARMEVNLVTTTLDVDTLNIKSVKINTVDWGEPIKLLVNTENTGNTTNSPSKITLEIQNLNQQKVDSQEVSKLEKINPNTIKEIIAEFKNNLKSSGEYFALVKIFNGNKEIYSDRLVFKINPDPENATQLPLEKTGFLKFQNGFINGIILALKQNKIESISITFSLIIALIIVFLIFKTFKKFHLQKIFFVYLIFHILVSYLLINNYHQKRLSDMAKPLDAGSVQGEATEINQPAADNSPLIINKNPGYSIYRTPDINSDIIYTAEENEEFKVISQNDNWYQVSLGYGSGGWIQKSSVKSSQ